MKKFLLLVSALILAAACSAPPTNREAAPNANTASEPAAAAMTEATAIATEKAVWDTIKNKDYTAFGNMLADDQLEVMGEAVNDKAASIAGVKDFEPGDVTFSEWKFLSIDKDAFVVVYTVTSAKAKYKGKELPASTDRASSAWVRRAGKWLAIYHQECPVSPAKPSAATPAKSPAKATASPAGTPTMAMATTGPDPVANEKIVWDFFKAKNYDGFAAVLAPDFIEVEPDAVTDKAASVKGVMGFDASKAVLSDWKTAKLGDDAMLDTYTVKMPGMPGNGERHSSIWARRDGKWVAVFHNGGTPVTMPGMMVTTREKEAATPATKAPVKNP
jgi:hypothetical protein